MTKTARFTRIQHRLEQQKSKACFSLMPMKVYEEGADDENSTARRKSRHPFERKITCRFCTLTSKLRIRRQPQVRARLLHAHSYKYYKQAAGDQPIH